MAFQVVLNERPLCSVHRILSLPPFPCGLPVSMCLGLWSPMCSLILPMGLVSAALPGRLSPSLWQSVALTRPWSMFPHSCTALQVTLGNCSAESDTHCGCQSGWCVDCSTEPCGKSSPFSCVQCPDYDATASPREYSMLGRLPLKLFLSTPFSAVLTQTAFWSAGPCPPGFYIHGNGCTSCPT